MHVHIEKGVKNAKYSWTQIGENSLSLSSPSSRPSRRAGSPPPGGAPAAAARGRSGPVGGSAWLCGRLLAPARRRRGCQEGAAPGISARPGRRYLGRGPWTRAERKPLTPPPPAPEAPESPARGLAGGREGRGRAALVHLRGGRREPGGSSRVRAGNVLHVRAGNGLRGVSFAFAGRGRGCARESVTLDLPTAAGETGAGCARG